MIDMNASLMETLSACQKEIERNPGCIDAHLKLGLLYKQEGVYDKALACYAKVIALDPSLPQVYNSMGTAWRALGDLTRAAACFRKALDVKPDYIVARFNLGNTLQKLGGLDAAVVCYKTVLSLDPGFIPAYHGLGLAYQACGKIEKAAECFARIAARDPSNAAALAYLLHQYQHLCLWNQAEQTGAKLDALFGRSLKGDRIPAEPPFLNLTRHADPALNYAVAKAWSLGIERRMAPFTHQLGRPPAGSMQQGKIVVGYFSSHFRDHASAHLLRGIFALHDRRRFVIQCYSSGRSDDTIYSQQIQTECDRFINLERLDHLQAAKCIRANGVQILIDLMGHTSGNRLEIAALRPAPVQVRWLGMAGTTGAGFFDYLITDAVVTPVEQECCYSEKFVFMPHSYQVNDNRQPIAPMELTRTDVGLPENGPVFCCFCANYKIDRAVFEAWMRILSRADTSVLWLLPQTPAVVATLRGEAEKRGISSDRLIMACKLAKAEHLARLHLADIALDTLTVNGAATTSDALRANVPVITLCGAHFASRMSSSILSALGLQQLITQKLSTYEDLAVRLANHPCELTGLKSKLADQIRSQPLFDTARYVKNLENALSAMWETYSSNNAPRHLWVTDSGPSQKCAAPQLIVG